MAHGDTGTARCQILYVDAPKGKGPWRYKTDQGGGAPARFKAWDKLDGITPDAVATFTWEEKHSEREGRHFVDHFVTSMEEVTPGSPSDELGTGQGDYKPPPPAREKLEAQHRMGYFAAHRIAAMHLGPGGVIEEYETRAGLILAGMDSYVSSQVDSPASDEAETGADGVPF